MKKGKIIFSESPTDLLVSWVGLVPMAIQAARESGKARLQFVGSLIEEVGEKEV